ncbi:lysylphosphatidylglycerol synthase transmembrane domain-containing protein [Bythopirellula polymerisocia]|uniref:Flippase-like domain-containing protein n=1 Tax=Bythopirellula polymerisocia TaxID=2528003 RepID=A0A5C6CMN8_9BACT|nr:lysylphosphatidylglycerol synthase transmembrane domain-containing protein [Bythopirellula polymerisocia]TWU25642.1 hypothetical protein Pla144_28510 [Bythopirellula polymerisocia]
MSLPKSLKILVTVCKVALALGIVIYLVAKIEGDAGFSRLVSEPKDWPFLAAALVLVLVSFSFSFVRWYLLVHGLGMQFLLSDAFRLGTLGFMLNQVMPGSVGGDLFKAAFIAHEQPGRRTEAVASVFIDRFVGLVGMLVVASVGLIFAGQSLRDSPLLKGVEVIVWTATAAGLAMLMLMTSRLVSGNWMQNLLGKIPLVGHPLSQLSEGLANFRSHRLYLVAAFCLALSTHCLLVTAFWFISRGLPITGPSFQNNATIVPMALVAGALPLTPGGLGLTETGLAKLFGTIGLRESDGAMVALCYRALTYVVAALGAFYYIAAKKRIDKLLVEAEELAEEIA